MSHVHCAWCGRMPRWRRRVCLYRGRAASGPAIPIRWLNSGKWLAECGQNVYPGMKGTTYATTPEESLVRPWGIVREEFVTRKKCPHYTGFLLANCCLISDTVKALPPVRLYTIRF